MSGQMSTSPLSSTSTQNQTFDSIVPESTPTLNQPLNPALNQPLNPTLNQPLNQPLDSTSSTSSHPFDDCDRFKKHPPIPVMNFIIDSKTGEILEDRIGQP